MKKVFLYAYDKQNLGDDLFIYTITRRYPDIQFYIWSDKSNQITFRSIPNLIVLDKDGLFVRTLNWLRPSFVPRYRAFWEKRCIAVVYIGGSIFMEYENWEQILNWWEYEAKNHPFYVMGANFGPYKTEGFRNRLAEIFHDVKDVCFRDQYSYQKFSDISTVRCAPDILFSYPMPKVPVIPKQLFVSPIDCFSRGEGETSLSVYGERYIAVLANLLNDYLNDGFSLVFASFCSAEGDEKAIRIILDAMSLKPDDPKIKIICYNGRNADEIATSIAESEYVIATRFHAAILSLVAGRPVFPIVYSDKTVHVLEDINFQGNYADLRSMTSISYIDSRNNLDTLSGVNIKNLSKEAQEHFAVLDQRMGQTE